MSLAAAQLVAELNVEPVRSDWGVTDFEWGGVRVQERVELAAGPGLLLTDGQLVMFDGNRGQWVCGGHVRGSRYG